MFSLIRLRPRVRFRLIRPMFRLIRLMFKLMPRPRPRFRLIRLRFKLMPSYGLRLGLGLLGLGLSLCLGQGLGLGLCYWIYKMQFSIWNQKLKTNKRNHLVFTTINCSQINYTNFYNESLLVPLLSPHQTKITFWIDPLPYSCIDEGQLIAYLLIQFIFNTFFSFLFPMNNFYGDF